MEDLGRGSLCTPRSVMSLQVLEGLGDSGCWSPASTSCHIRGSAGVFGPDSGLCSAAFTQDTSASSKTGQKGDISSPRSHS